MDRLELPWHTAKSKINRSLTSIWSRMDIYEVLKLKTDNFDALLDENSYITSLKAFISSYKGCM